MILFKIWAKNKVKSYIYCVNQFLREKHHKKWNRECKQKQSFLFSFCNIFYLSTCRTQNIAMWHPVFEPDFYMIYYRCLCSLTLGPSPLGPHLVGPRPQKYCKNKFMNKAYHLFKIIFIQDSNIILVQDIQKGQAILSKINGKAFHHSSFFSSITKETEKTLWCNTFNKFTTSQLFLNIKTCSYI